MPVIATQNMKKRDMFNMMEFEIKQVIEMEEGNTLNFIIGEERFDLNEFRESFLPNFAIHFINIKVIKLMSIIIFGILIKWISKRCTQAYLVEQSPNIFILTTKKYVSNIENDLKIK